MKTDRIIPSFSCQLFSPASPLRGLFTLLIALLTVIGSANRALGETTLLTSDVFGTNAGNATMTGDYNTGHGYQALSNNTSGANNTANGTAALAANTTGGNNVASGYAALGSNTIGSANVANGSQALFINTTGSNNTAIGAQALGNSIGNNNLAVGEGAGVNLTNGNNNIYLGNIGQKNESNTIYLGQQGLQKTAYVAGIYGTNVNGGAFVVVTATGQLGTTNIIALTGPQGPSGTNGTNGANGTNGTSATVTIGTTTTGAAGSSATVSNSGTAGAAVLNFTIPTGVTGATGATGTAATVRIGTTTTGAVGSSATVTNSGTAGAAVLNFTIPTGATGAVGMTFRGVWTSNVTYAVNDTVTWGGSTWLSVTNANLGHNPGTDTGADWTVLSAAGTVASGMWLVTPTNAPTPADCLLLGTTTMSYKSKVITTNASNGRVTTKTVTKTLNLNLYQKN